MLEAKEAGVWRHWWQRLVAQHTGLLRRWKADSNTSWHLGCPLEASVHSGGRAPPRLVLSGKAPEAHFLDSLKLTINIVQPGWPTTSQVVQAVFQQTLLLLHLPRVRITRVCLFLYVQGHAGHDRPVTGWPSESPQLEVQCMKQCPLREHLCNKSTHMLCL